MFTEKRSLFLVMITTSMFLTGYYYSLLPSISQLPTITVTQELKVGVCEVIHLGVVCISQSSKLNFYPLLKSIFYHRNNPIHFHIAVNDQTKKCLNKLFRTWSVPQVDVSFYNITHISPKIGSKVLNTFKLVIPKIIESQTASKIIFLSTNIVFNDDVYEIWSTFRGFQENQVLGKPLKYLKEQDNSSDPDIVLFHLDNLRRYGWTSKVEHTIPCIWNSKTNCLHEFKVINRNRKELISGIILSSNANYNGNKVLRINNNCIKKLQVVHRKKSKNNMCVKFPKSEIHVKRTLLYIYHYSYVPSDLDVTLISQLSFKKLNMLEEFAVRWEGPISVAIYLSDAEYIKCTKFIKNSTVLRNRLNIGYHVVFTDAYSHPINYLRNVALKEVNTPFVFLNDIDLIPMQNLYSVIKSHLHNIHDTKKTALVVPAFQTEKVNIKIPSTMNELLEMWDKKTISMFKIIIFFRGHSPTNYKKLRTATKPYKVQWKHEYEPYVVVKRDVIKYDERFFAYGWDKISHIMELKAQDYEFLVLPNTFVVHKYHKITEDKVTFLTSRKYKLCIESIKRQFIKDLNKKYSKRFQMLK